MQLLEFIKLLGMIYGVGAATFAIVFYYKALEDGKVDASEHNFIDTVYFILRIGMLVLVITEVTLVALAYRQGVAGLTYLHNPELWMRLIILTLLNVNAVLMTKNIIPWFLATIILGGSWYAYLIFSLWKPENISFTVLISAYCVFLIVFGLVLDFIQNLYLGKNRSE